MSFNHKKLVTFFSPNMHGGGAERVISTLITSFSEKGYNIDLLLLKKEGPYLKDIPSNVNVIEFGSKKLIYSIPKLIKYLFLNKPDIIFTSHIHFSTVVAFFSKIPSPQTSVIIRQPTMLYPSQKKMNFLDLLRLKIFRCSLNFVDKIVLSSNFMRDEFLKFSFSTSHKIFVVHNPVNINNVKINCKEEINVLFFDNNLPKIISVGRMTEVKDFSTLIKAFSIVRNKVPCNLIILGDGSLKPNLIELTKKLCIEDYVLMPGFVNNPHKYIAASDIFVSCSLWEGFPNVLVEAMACDVKIVATDCEGGTSEILESGKWGSLVPISNEFELANSIIESLQKPKSTEASVRVNDFSVQKISDEYERIFFN